MRGFVLQDWVTIRGATVVTQVVQNEAGWLSLEAYQDAIFQVQVTELSLGGGSSAFLNLETAPIKDESLWLPMGVHSTGIALTAGVVGGNNSLQVILSAIGANGGNPLSRWVRWRLIPPTGATSPPWDLTFRVLVSCNQLFSVGGGGYGGGGGGGWGPQMR